MIRLNQRDPANTIQGNCHRNQPVTGANLHLVCVTSTGCALSFGLSHHVDRSDMPWLMKDYLDNCRAESQKSLSHGLRIDLGDRSRF